MALVVRQLQTELDPSSVRVISQLLTHFNPLIMTRLYLWVFLLAVDLTSHLFGQDNLFGGESLPTAPQFAGAPGLSASQLYPALAHPNITSPPSPTHLTPPPKHAPNPGLGNIANISPSIAAAVTSLLNSFGNSSNTAPPMTPTTTSGERTYSRKKPGKNICEPLFIFSFPPPRDQSLQVYQGASEAYENLLQNHEEN